MNTAHTWAGKLYSPPVQTHRDALHQSRGWLHLRRVIAEAAAQVAQAQVAAVHGAPLAGAPSISGRRVEADRHKAGISHSGTICAALDAQRTAAVVAAGVDVAHSDGSRLLGQAAPHIKSAHLRAISNEATAGASLGVPPIGAIPKEPRLCGIGSTDAAAPHFVLATMNRINARGIPGCAAHGSAPHGSSRVGG